MVKAIDVHKTHKTISVMITIALFDKRFRDKIFLKFDLIYYSSITYYHLFRKLLFKRYFITLMKLIEIYEISILFFKLYSKI